MREAIVQNFADYEAGQFGAMSPKKVGPARGVALAVGRWRTRRPVGKSAVFRFQY